MTELLEKTYYSNSVEDYFIALAIILIGSILVAAFRRIVLQKVKKWTSRTNTHLDNYVVESADRFGIPALYVGVIYIGLNYLLLAEKVKDAIYAITTVAVTILVIRFVSNTVKLLLQSYIRRQDNGEEKVKQLQGINLIISVIIWFVGLMFLFDNLGYDITAIVAGLGIGGIAVALAAQNILGDLFNYFVIFFDRPFEVGDFVVIDDKNGVIENIGVKTTRIKTLSGEQLVVSNSDLTNSRIHNYKRMQRRRVVFKLNVTYQTSLENLRKIPDVIKAAVLAQSPVEFDRSHFVSYGDSSLDFETVYYILDSDYTVYMNIHQQINLRIFEEFAKMGVEFAYPTRTLFVQTEENGKAENASALLAE
ncbi:mechanosensitive ion channel family protein [Botryobacter ruber]|uniref:mechanosensitive ion channel family protein n=1 Tax=Botryobacter ruber TaxID=2171629 RepID=UPI000E0A5F02|nr:mechanosensitive ion channel family protein [Botryobacter ruber]